MRETCGEMVALESDMRSISSYWLSPDTDLNGLNGGMLFPLIGVKDKARTVPGFGGAFFYLEVEGGIACVSFMIGVGMCDKKQYLRFSDVFVDENPVVYVQGRKRVFRLISLTI